MNIKPLFFDTYLATIKNSAGTNMHRTLYAEVDGKKQNVLQDGELSCAAFTSSILYFFKLISDRHATTASTVKDMKESGWRKIKKPKIGCVLVWEEVVLKDGDKPYPHIGFYIDDETAVSNSRRKKTPQEHHWTYGEKDGKPMRKIVGMYWHDRLNDKYF